MAIRNSCLSEQKLFPELLLCAIASPAMLSGYFGDGFFRILCYPNPYRRSNQSLAIIFAVHDTDFDIANTFVQIAINQIAD